VCAVYLLHYTQQMGTNLRQNMLFMEICSATIRNACSGAHWEHQVVLVDRNMVLQTLWKLVAELCSSVLHVSEHPEMQATVINRIT
jgi:hypothetical protein